MNQTLSTPTFSCLKKSNLRAGSEGHRPTETAGTQRVTDLQRDSRNHQVERPQNETETKERNYRRSAALSVWCVLNSVTAPDAGELQRGPV